MVMGASSGKASSRNATGVVFAVAAFTAEVGGSTASVTQPKSYDCNRPWWQPVTALFGQDWSSDQKEWCCAQHGIGCPAVHEPVVEKEYDCEQELEQWESRWSDNQKRWCCENKNLGCLALEWSSEPYHCQEGLKDWKTKWSKGKKKWCCHFDNLGCEEEEQEEGHDIEKAPSSSSSLVVTSDKFGSSSSTAPPTTLEPHDCQNELSCWESTWSDSKKSWCCEHYHLGCASVVADATTTTAAQATTSPMTTTISAATAAKIQNAPEAQPAESEEATTTAEGVHNLTVGEDGGDPPYECREYAGDVDDDNSQEAWPAEQQAWCCQHELKGCTTCDTVCFVNSIAASCRSRIAWLKTHQFKSEDENSCTSAHSNVLKECAVCSRCDLDDGCPAKSSASMVAYHCEPGEDNELESWPVAKQQWCCRHNGKGCPSTATMTTTKAYDCIDGVQQWQTQWDHAKRTWCCKTSQIGCTGCDRNCALQGFSASCRDRIDWLKNHDFADLEHSCTSSRTVVLDQCNSCSECSVEDACPARSSRPLHDCDEDLQNWRRAWSQEKTRWCCQSEAKGCEEWATNTADDEVFDCKADVENGERHWSVAKRTWCCAHEMLGCPQTFDCKKDLSSWRSLWAKEKTTWCCENEGLGCQELDLAPFEPYDCKSERTSWTPGQRAWCCSHHAMGCEATQAEGDGHGRGEQENRSVHYDCKVGVLHWADRWPAEKQQWCCKRFMLGCPTIVEELGAATKAIQSTTSSPPTSASYDCLLGFANWRNAWNHEKAAWCCEHQLRGCHIGGEPKGVAAPTHSPQAQSTGALAGGSYDCDNDQPELWSDTRTEWCCEQQGRGCSSTATLSTTQQTRTRTSTTKTTATTTTEQAQQQGSSSGQVAQGVANTWCFEQDVAYLPLDMLGTVLNYVSTAEDCQQRCRSTYQCTHFTYYTQEGICHVADMWSNPQAGCLGVVSGPPNCTIDVSKALTWVVKDSLPEVEGETFNDIGSGYKSLDEMKQWCEGRGNCVGFAYQALSGRWYPTKSGTGFDPRTAVWASSWGEHWQWYYIQERTEMGNMAVERKFEEQIERANFDPRPAKASAASASTYVVLVAIFAALIFGAIAFVGSRMWSMRRQPGYSAVNGDTPLPLFE